MEKGLKCLRDVVIQILFKNEKISDEINLEMQPNDSSNNINSPDNLDFVNNHFFSSQNASNNEKTSSNNESLIFKRNKEIEAEIIYFSTLLSDPKVINSSSSTKEFWLKYRQNMPYLFDLQIVLLNIPSSSSFIERFFSISGIVCDSRRLNMTDELVIIRSLLKANMTLLNELHEIN